MNIMIACSLSRVGSVRCEVLCNLNLYGLYPGVGVLMLLLVGWV